MTSATTLPTLTSLHKEIILDHYAAVETLAIIIVQKRRRSSVWSLDPISTFVIDLRIFLDARLRYFPVLLHISPSLPRPEDINTPITMNDTVTTGEVYKVEFSPPLHVQRRNWALEILKRERVAKVGPFCREIVASTD